MSAIKWTKELLAEVRNENGVVFGMMSEEARVALHDVRRSQGYVSAEECRVECFSHSHDWVRIWGPFNDLSPHRAYRLSPSYTPPELEEKPWVDVPVTVNERNLCVYKSPYSPPYEFTVECAQANKTFIGYVYANGACSTQPRIDNLSGDGPAEAPVAVRFWKGDAK